MGSGVESTVRARRPGHIGNRCPSGRSAGTHALPGRRSTR